MTNSAGEPIIAAPMFASRVRDAEGRQSRAFTFPNFQRTDDRGIYRFYGLEPGAYIVSVGGHGRPFYGLSPYDNDAPTYAPSSTRDTAAEIIVRSGEEASGVDIRYRGEHGRAVSGRVIGALSFNPNNVGINILLAHAGSGAVEATTYSSPRAEDRPFAFYGVPDGEYDLTAQVFQNGTGNNEGLASPPRRVIVKGANVTGVELTLAPLASIAGRITLEPSREDVCAKQPPETRLQEATLHDARPREQVIIMRRDDQDISKDQPRSTLPASADATPNEQGEFTIRNLNAGRYHLEARLAGDNWYVRALTRAAASQSQPTRAPSVKAKPTTESKAQTGAESNDVARNTLSLKQGERIKGLNVIVAEGAASLRGRVTTEANGARLPNNLRAYLVPAEREAADDVFRYAETAVNSDGTFAFANLPPGHYYFITRPRPANENLEASTRPLVWDTAARARLRLAAEAANSNIELQPCQRVVKTVTSDK